MIDALMLVLREALEAALILSLLLALSEHLSLSRRWVYWAIPIGLLGSLLLSHFAGAIAEANEGTGQELVNAGLCLLAILACLGIAVWAPQKRRGSDAMIKVDRLLQSCFGVIVACAIAREVCEVWIYMSGFQTQWRGLILGGLVGIGIGASLGAIVYFGFAFMQRGTFIPVCLLLIALFAGGLSLQMAKQLLQIGWLDGGPALWNLAWFISEQSWFGQFLHALFGYDANPDRTQVIFYLSCQASFAAICGFQLWRQHRGGTA